MVSCETKTKWHVIFKIHFHNKRYLQKHEMYVQSAQILQKLSEVSGITLHKRILISTLFPICVALEYACFNKRPSMLKEKPASI